MWNHVCYFSGSTETIDHLLFARPVAKVIWGMIPFCFDQHDRPSSYEQFWPWVKYALSGGEHVFMLGLASICWVI
jgi:hypothetical protein